MAGLHEVTLDDEDDDLAAARWLIAIDAGLEPGRSEAFHAWLAARPERAELMARQAALPAVAREALIQQAAQQALARRAKEQAQRSRRRFLIGGAIVAGAMAAGVAGVVVRAPWLDRHEVYETAAGEVRAVELADGSRLWLDAHTQAAVRMTKARRDVHLASGRLFVEVAHAPERPFRVSGASFEARAVGTAFEATVFPNRTGVMVTEGVVRLTQRNGVSAIDLTAGQGAWIAASGEVTRTTSALAGIGAWRQHRMVLADRRLDAALAELSRYFDRPLTVVDAQLAARRVSLSFSIADLDETAAARIIADAVGADIADQASAGVLLSPAAPDGDASLQRPPQPR